MLPQKIENWLQQKSLPQRLILSGNKNNLDLAIEILKKMGGFNPEKIKQGIEPDVLCLKDEGESFRIGSNENPEKNTARGVIKWINQSPIASHRVLILENFERASREAPQTLLKTLEEPPPHALFIFTTKNHHQILPTILSRMTTVVIPTDFDEFLLIPEVKMFLENSSIIKKFRFIEELDKIVKKEKNKKTLHDFLENLVLHARYFNQYQVHLEKVFQAQLDIKSNLNPRLVLEALALNLEKR